LGYCRIIHFSKLTVPPSINILRQLLALLLILAITGCATSSHITNTPITEVKSVDFTQLPAGRKGQRSSEIGLAVAFSGGGTRAAAFSYGVLEKLRDTRYMNNGKETRLLDEIDFISSVSGGSFTAAYYGLYGDRIFEDYEEVFLRRNVQKSLIAGLFNPLNWFSGRNRTDMAIKHYNKYIFRGSTFADIHANDGPRIDINATDLGNAERFVFSQEQFNMLCSDLDSFEVARAVAASSAVPVAFVPILLENYSGCNYTDPPHVATARRNAADDTRVAALIESYDSYKDKEERRYIHLVDGGITDNIGIRNLHNFMEIHGGALAASRDLGNKPRYIIAIVVNAETRGVNPMGRSTEPPSTGEVVSAVTSAQLSRYNLETLALLEESMQKWAAELSTPEQPVKPFIIALDFDNIVDVEVRRIFNNMATSFSLPDDDVDKLIEAGHSLLEASPEFQELIATIRQER
jgi:NTE family protein